MRRRDNEISDRSLIDQIIKKAQVCRLGMCIRNQPYVVPLSFGYDGEYIYVHTALEGSKINYWTSNPNICFEMEVDVDLVKDEEIACNWSQSYYSVIGYGTIEEINWPEGRTLAFNQIMLHYSDRAWEFDPAVMEKSRLWRIEIEQVSGKKSKDKTGL